MTVLPQKGALPQPLLKAPSTVQSSSLEAIANNGNNEPSTHFQSRSRPQKTRHDAPPTDSTSTSATLALIRRILIPDKPHGLDPRASPKPIEDRLPPLTSSNDIDVQLYAIVAIIIKDFVNTWYANITTDHQFVEEIIQIIAHCSRALEQRIRCIDIVEILLDELPALLERHIQAYRTATTASTEYSYSTEVHQTYHTLNPHPALDPFPGTIDPQVASEQARNETIYRQLLIHGTLAVLLPTEDLQNTPLRLLVGDILADLIVGQALAGKICEGWFIYDTITKVVGVVKERAEPKASGQDLRQDAKNRLEKFGLLNSEEDDETSRLSTAGQSILSIWFWQVLQIGYFVFLILRFFVKGISQARMLPQRSHTSHAAVGSPVVSALQDKNRQLNESLRPVLDYNVYSMIASLLRFRQRMPWLVSTLMFWQHVLLFGVGRLAATNSVFDRFLHNTIQTNLLSSKIIPPILLNLRIALFPNNSLGPPAPPPPTTEQRQIIKRKAAESILSLIPPIVSHTYFASSDTEEILNHIESDILDVFEHNYLNKHFVYGILELIMCRLVPELVVTGGSISDLLAERGVLLGSSEGDRDGGDDDDVVSKRRGRQ